MITIKVFNKSHNYSDELKLKENNSIILYALDFNDFGYYVNFEAYYYDSEGKEHKLGLYRIFRYKDEKEHIQFDLHTYECLKSDKKTENLDLHELTNYFSIAAYESFYLNLYEKVGDDYDDFLNKVNDLTFKESINSNKLEEIKSSFLECNESEKVLYRDYYEVKSIVKFAIFLKSIFKDEMNLGNYIEKLFSKEDYKKKFLEEYNLYNYQTLLNIIEFYKKYQKNKEVSDENFRFCNDLLNKASENSRTDLSILKSKLLSYVDENLTNIFQDVESIKEKLKFKKEELDSIRSFVHYTGIDTLSILIQKEKEEEKVKCSPVLRLSNARQMNDPKEGVIIFQLLDFSERQIEVDYIPSSYYFASMALKDENNHIDDSLPMWKMYGGNAEGICLTYHNKYIEDLIDSEIEIYKVVYSNQVDEQFNEPIKKTLEDLKKHLNKLKEDSQTVEDWNDKLKSALEFLEPIRYLFKEGDYSYENEYRIIVNYEGREDELEVQDNSVPPRPYAFIRKQFLKYSEVKIGPNAKDIDFIAPYIKYIDNNIKVTKSSIPYRES
ncbi:DUF2971 domain-containing protein [Streptococcus salivarius]|uniref:DUF2971 domain-containing protein n=1 Tax=Streptococcus salivarius TaxID=1304 RepID=UPI00397D4A84